MKLLTDNCVGGCTFSACFHNWQASNGFGLVDHRWRDNQTVSEDGAAYGSWAEVRPPLKMVANNTDCCSIHSSTTRSTHHHRQHTTPLNRMVEVLLTYKHV